MSSLARYLTSSIGKKFVMGGTGLIWSGFVFVHMAGNLLILVSGDLYNRYSYAIVSDKPLLYGTEIVLLVAVILHVWTAFALTYENKRARPEGYQHKVNGKAAATLASKTMIYTGSIVLVFLIVHIATFKYGTYYGTTINNIEMRDIYRLVRETFANPLYVAAYIVCLVALGFHLKHGFNASLQSLGFRHPQYTPALRALSVVYAVVVAGGFIVQPIAVYFSAR